MKKVLFVFSLILILGSCNKRTDYFVANNLSPTATITLNGEYSSLTSTVVAHVVTDTLKNGFYYRFTLDVLDEVDFVQLSYVGSGELYMDGQVFENGSVAIGEHDFEWKDTVVGMNTFSLTLSDAYGLESSSDFNIVVFDNYLPSLSWVLNPYGINDPLEKEIVVIAQDMDEIYGGEVTMYEFTIDGVVTTIPTNMFYHIFPSVGTYSIGVRVMDNNFEWSPILEIINYQIN
ncbi:MAG: hypothetical protein ACJASM_000902 [Salibacteraceae bacterium]|jgi:hypothetical protein